ncbi:hypothetical protein BaRGS_00004201 [Batillaria attramentaria]|uniref:Apple domain-containing protein n=1 Tax=Batillaria attramentaria TaxID=370345 RepID=A0ABD0LYU3_9CAEN
MLSEIQTLTLTLPRRVFSEECTSIGFDTFDNHYLQPDNVAAALVPAANMASCMFQCTSKPLPECRGVNTKEGDSECMHLTFLRSERGPERYVFDDEYKYHQRTCLIY